MQGILYFSFEPHVIRMSLVCHSYVTPMSLVCTRMSFVCHSYVLVCHLYVTRIYSYVLVCHQYVTRTSLVCTRMSSVCHSDVLVCDPYVTRMYSYVIRMSRVCGFTMNLLRTLTSEALNIILHKLKGTNDVIRL